MRLALALVLAVAVVVPLAGNAASLGAGGAPRAAGRKQTAFAVAPDGGTSQVNPASNGAGDPPANGIGGAYYEVPYIEMPKDDEGFVQEFDLDDVEAWRTFFDEYGIVVIRNVLSDEQCDATVDEMWSLLENIGIMRHDPRTWNRFPWGQHLGFLGNHAFLTPKASENRQNMKLYQVFRQLYATDHLYVSVDRIGYMRPTKHLNVPGYETPVDAPQWKSVKNWVHLDMNPFTGSTSTYAYQGNYPNNPHNVGFSRLKTQGILALDDAAEEDGGFHAIPGFHRHIQPWSRNHWNERHLYTFPTVEDETTMQIPYGDPIRNHVQTMPIRKGSLLVWNSAIPHGTHPNNSNRSRIVQYLKMAPASDPAIVPAAVNSTSAHNTVQRFRRSFLPPPESGFQLTPLGERLYGFVPWSPDDSAEALVPNPNELLPLPSAPVGPSGPDFAPLTVSV